MKQFLKKKLIFILVVMALLVTAIAIPLLSVGVSPARASGVHTLSAQMRKIATSAPADAVRVQLANLIADPALGQWAAELTTQGGKNLTSFQRDLLKAVQIEARYGHVLSKRLNGTRLSEDDREKLAELREKLLDNPAIQRLLEAGEQLKHHSPLLTQDITGVVNTLNGPKETPAPTGDAPRDAVLTNLSAIINGSAFAQLSSSTLPVLSDPGAPAFIATLHPEALATFLPPAQTIALLIPNDHDPALTDIIKSGLEIIGGVAGVIAAVALAPEELAGAALVGVVAGIVAAGSAIIVGIIDLGTSLDCDHDGDPYDPGDVPGNEC